MNKLTFIIRVFKFKKELKLLLKKYNLELYAGWISSEDDDNNLIIRDLDSGKEKYIDLE